MPGWPGVRTSGAGRGALGPRGPALRGRGMPGPPKFALVVGGPKKRPGQGTARAARVDPIPECVHVVRPFGPEP